MSKNMMEPERQQMASQYGAYALDAGWVRLHAREPMHTPMHPVTHQRPQARIHARKRTHPHRQIYNTYCFSTEKMFRESDSMLRYTHIACLVASCCCANRVLKARSAICFCYWCLGLLQQWQCHPKVWSKAICRICKIYNVLFVCLPSCPKRSAGRE